MANQIITSANSIATTTGSAISSFDSSNTLIIASGAWVISSDSTPFTPTISFDTLVSGGSAVLAIDGYVAGASEPVIFLRGMSSASVTIGETGVITNPISGTGARALYLDVDTVAFVTNMGQIFGDIQSLGSGVLNLENGGLIQGRILGNDSDDTLDNYGTIGSDIDLGDGANILNNGSGAYLFTYFGGADFDDITNYGTIARDIRLLDIGNPSVAANTLTNGAGGFIGGRVSGDIGLEIIENYGSINQLSLNAGGSVVTNAAGAIITNGIYAGAGSDSISNEGRIAVAVSLGADGNFVTNSGVITSSVACDANGTLSVTNTGVIGGIAGGNGIDTYSGVDGRLTAAAFLGGGADVFFGGDYAEVVLGGLGVDQVDLGGGNDRFYATDGGDGSEDIYGGAGGDTYDASSTNAALSIFLEEGTASSADVGTDALFDFEHVVGSSAGDLISGDTGANALSGGLGADRLFGEGGDDVLRGDDGADRLTGGVGRDRLFGGLADGDVDRFIISTLADSTVAAAGRDFIYQFVSGVDDIDLSLIDARTNVAANNAFTFIGTGAFTGVSGQLRYAVANGVANVSGDVNGDAVADFMISVVGASSLVAGDFIL